MKFQIAGLPRSGTAWLASVLNLCPDVICVHEPADNNVPKPSGIYPNEGESGSHLLIPKCRDEHADLRIYINRPLEESFASLVKVTDGNVDAEWWDSSVIALAEEYIQKADMIFDFNNLFTEDTVSEIWKAVSSSAFESDKVRLMCGMNTQRNSLEYDIDEAFMNKFIDNQIKEREILCR